MALGWSHRQAMSTPLSITMLAVRGRVEMLEGFGNYVVSVLLNGPPDKRTPQEIAAEKVKSQFDKLIAEGF